MTDAPTDAPTDARSELPTRYDPSELERRWARRWADEPLAADPASDKPPFTIVIPPPNVTGNLHLGHAFDNAIIDALIRFKRMQGFEALFQPGTDHAGISTQVQVERALRAEGLDRHRLGREAFLERVWAWKERYGGIILEQLQRLGISADWTRTRFTLDEGLSKAVRKQFVELFHRGAVYRGERIVNWDPASQTTLSDLEVEREERTGKLYRLRYAGEDGGDAIEIATVRPETIFADQAVAVHPEDERFAHLVGRRVRIPLTDRFVPVIKDEAVEQDFGTGALKITPAHDPTDFEIGERHGLDRPSVIDLEGRLATELVPEAFRGIDRFAARDAVVAALEAEGALVSVADHTVALGLSQRTGEPVEPLLSTQWFYDTSKAAARALEALDSGALRVVPERYTKVNKDWLAKLRPWNVSRQLWWGHRIPAWYDEDGQVIVPDPSDPYLDPSDDPRYAGRTLTQDPDVFDTWFSSNLWPFSTLGWPDVDDPFFRRFYPTSVLVTGYDILFFWVARMELAAFEFTDQAPFHTVVLHGLVLDADGQKMSKSKGNGIDPLEVIDESGADALRFAMAHASTGGQDVRWDPRRVEMGRNFCTKLWNAARFVRTNLDGPEDAGVPERLADRWILAELQTATADVTAALEAFDLGAAARRAYDFTWSTFCDWYLEAAKPALREDDPRTRATLRRAFEGVLALLHPIMPFVTSELWSVLGHERQLAESDWPTADPTLQDAGAQRDFERLQAAVAAVRQLRVDADLPPNQAVPVVLEGEGAAALATEASVFESLARARVQATAPGGASLAQPVADVVLRLPFEGVVDVAAWTAKQEARLATQRAEAARSSKKLANERFVAGAPDEVVAEERRRLGEAERLASEIEASLARLA
ncbi:MAG: valine--tRNA ligase [Trueperaceae bacterium]